MRRLISLTLALLLTLLPFSALAEGDETAPVQALADFVQSTLDQDGDLLYEAYEDYNTYGLLFEAEDNRLGDIIAYLDVYNSGILVQACYEQSAPADRLDEIARFMAMVNAELLGSKYYLYYESGSIIYEIFLFMDFTDVAALDQTAQATLLDFLFSVVDEIDYDVEYFVEIIGGETAENVYAMYIADLDQYE